MTEPEALELIESVNRRRDEVSPVHDPDAHRQLVEDLNKLVAAGYELQPDGEGRKVS